MSFRFQSDQNTREICKALREAGARVEYWKGFSRQKGVPDLIVGYAGVTWLIEVKSDKGVLSPEQVAWHEAWRKVGGPIATIKTLKEAMAAIGMEPVF